VIGDALAHGVEGSRGVGDFGRTVLLQGRGRPTQVEAVGSVGEVG
jgi:hypothetical protein